MQDKLAASARALCRALTFECFFLVHHSETSSSSESDSEDDVARFNAGYQPLTSFDGSGCGSGSDDPIDATGAAMSDNNTSHTGGPGHEGASTFSVGMNKAMAMDLRAQYPPPSREPTRPLLPAATGFNLGASQIDAIKAAMADFKIPDDSMPAWARYISAVLVCLVLTNIAGLRVARCSVLSPAFFSHCPLYASVYSSLDEALWRQQLNKLVPMPPQRSAGAEPAEPAEPTEPADSSAAGTSPDLGA